MAKDIIRAKKRIQGTVPSKKNAIYNSNLYWSQKPYNIADILIEELSEEGEVVFDPFLGSGVTLLEAVRKKYKRIGIGCEINEAPLLIVSTLLNDYDLNADKYFPTLAKSITVENYKLGKYLFPNLKLLIKNNFLLGLTPINYLELDIESLNNDSNNQKMKMIDLIVDSLTAADSIFYLAANDKSDQGDVLQT